MEIRMRIAGIGVRISAESPFEGIAAPQSWLPFIDERVEAELTLRVMMRDQCPMGKEKQKSQWELLAEAANDLGSIRLFRQDRRYAVGVKAEEKGREYLMLFNEDFSEAEAWLDPKDGATAYVLDSMARIWMAQGIARRGGFMIHASAVSGPEGKGYIFLGNSGTGKSTHARMWMEEISGTTLLNDDNPIVRIDADGTPRVWGTPWSGKTPCWINGSAPLGGIVRIAQATENEYVSLRDADAFVGVIGSVSVISASRELYDSVCQTLLEILGKVKTGRMDCRADREAAAVCAWRVRSEG